MPATQPNVQEEEQLSRRLVAALSTGGIQRELDHLRCVQEDSKYLDGKGEQGADKSGVFEDDWLFDNGKSHHRGNDNRNKAGKEVAPVLLQPPGESRNEEAEDGRQADEHVAEAGGRLLPFIFLAHTKLDVCGDVPGCGEEAKEESVVEIVPREVFVDLTRDCRRRLL